MNSSLQISQMCQGGQGSGSCQTHTRCYLVRESHRLPKPERQSHFHDTRAVICQQKRSREMKTGCKLLGPLVPLPAWGH